MDHRSRHLWIKKANKEADMGWALGLGMFCGLKSDFFFGRYTNPAARENTIRGSRIPRTLEQESEHGSRYAVGGGPGYILPIEMGFCGPTASKKHDLWDSGSMDHGSRNYGSIKRT